MDGVEALRHLREWLGKEAGLPLELLTGLEKVLAEEQVFQVEDLMLLRDGGMLDTVFSKYVTRRKVENALDRHALQVSGQQASGQRASSGWAAGERERSPAAGGGEAETTRSRSARSWSTARPSNSRSRRRSRSGRLRRDWSQPTSHDLVETRRRRSGWSGTASSHPRAATTARRRWPTRMWVEWASGSLPGRERPGCPRLP